MAKKGGNKKSCDKYKASGHRQENKARRKANHEKRMQRFADRKADGKSYTWKKDRAKEKIASGSDNYNPNTGEWMSNVGSNRSMHTEYSKNRSIFAKLNNEMTRKKMAEKKVFVDRGDVRGDRQEKNKR